MSDSTQPEPSSVPPAPTGAFARTAQIVRPAVRGVQWLAASPFGPFLGLIVVFGIFWGADTIKAQKLGRSSRFANVATVQKVLKDASLVGVASLGMTLIIIAGGIDLSAGAATAVCATVTAYGFLHEWPVALCLLAGFATGGLCGFLNGGLISILGVVPFIVTLGTMTAFNGLGLILSDNSSIKVQGRRELVDAAGELVRGDYIVPRWIVNLQVPYPIPKWLGVTSGVWVMIVLAILVWALLRFTVFGRHVFAIGSNEEAARLCGINIVKMRIAVYSIAGVLFGVAGLFQFAELGGEGNPNAGAGKELDFIAAVVIGGGSLSGGRGSVVGTLVGACIMATIRHGCVTVGVSTAWQKVILGVIIVGAVTLDQVRQRKAG